MSAALHPIAQAVHESTRRSVAARWPREEGAEALLEVAAGAAGHVEETVEGFRQLAGAKVDCAEGCSFCCWLRVDVRAHEVFLIVRRLRAERSEEALAALLGAARRAGGGGERPCVLREGGKCSIYAVRPMACRRYLSGSVEACEARWRGELGEVEIQHPLLAEVGRGAATAVHQGFIEAGYDGYSYDLGLALAEGLADPACEERWLGREKAFSEAAESPTPPGFSQGEALAGLKAALRGAAKLGAVVWLAGWVFGGSLGATELPSASSPIAAARGAAGSGEPLRKLRVGGLERSYRLYVPEGLGAGPVPVVLVLHGAGMNAGMMAAFCGMDAQAEISKFIAVYPNGTGWGEVFLTWNSGGIGTGRGKPDDVAFVRALLDDVAEAFPVDPQRVFAAGLSNGGMMSYRLGAELSDRIAAIAAVGGTLAVEDPRPGRPVSAIHFHGTADRMVPYGGPGRWGSKGMRFWSVPRTIARWAELVGCPAEGDVREVADRFADGTQVRTTTYGPGREGAEVVLVDIVGGGHTWPGQQPLVGLIGKSTREISANQMIWDFFVKHPRRP